jgi:L-lactate utilization protein LutC
MERSYLHFLNKLGVPVTADFQNAPVLLGGCESLIANEGAIMTTANHTKSFRNHELPAKRVIVALSTQIVPDKQQALIRINNKYQKPPANIQTMSIFAPPKDDFSGGKWYETYLFLIEN